MANLDAVCVGLNFSVAGLCNRLRTLAGAIVAGHALGLPVLMFWQPIPACPGKFQELFEIPDGVRIVCDPVCVQDSSLLGGAWHTESVAGTFFPFVSGIVSKKNFHLAWHTVVKSLRLAYSVKACFLSFLSSEWPSGHLVGVHVRRTDLASDCAARSRPVYISDDAIFARLDELVSELDCKFFLAADSHSARVPYLRRYGGRMFFRPVNMTPLVYHYRARHTTLADAVVDLWLLSRCSRIVGTYGSSFSSFAGIHGGIPVERLGGVSASGDRVS